MQNSGIIYHIYLDLLREGVPNENYEAYINGINENIRELNNKIDHLDEAKRQSSPYIESAYWFYRIKVLLDGLAARR